MKALKKIAVGAVALVALLFFIAINFPEYLNGTSGDFDKQQRLDGGTVLYTARCHLPILQLLPGSSNRDFAEITIKAKPCDGETHVVFSDSALRALRELYGEDSDHYRDIVRSAIVYPFMAANIEGGAPHVGATTFEAEVSEIKASRDAGRESNDILLTLAGIRATSAFVIRWEAEQQGRPAQ